MNLKNNRNVYNRIYQRDTPTVGERTEGKKMSGPILEMRHINKNYGIVTALKNVNLDVYPGEIRGLIGENGSGKSTITSIAAGMQKATSGTMMFGQREWKPDSMIDALQQGIGMIVQESGTIPGVTVAENIFLAEVFQFKNRFGIIDRKRMNARATEAMRAIGVENVTGDMQMSQLDFQIRKLVEIAKVMLKNPKILIIDETSTALSHDGRQILYRLMKQMREENKAVIFISHDLEEIMEVCDTLTVLRDGDPICTFQKEEFDADAIRTSMIGRELHGDYYRSDFEPSSGESDMLVADGLCKKGVLEHVSLTVKKGEIVGVGGLASCGMHALGKALFGELALDAGTHDLTSIGRNVCMRKRKGEKTMEEKTKSGANHYKMVQMLIKILPCAALAILFLIFIAVVAAKGYRMDMYLQIVFNEGVVLAAVAAGAIFIYTLAPFDHIGVKLVILGAFVAVCVFVFDFTKVGRRQKFIGGNPVCAALSGIESDKYTILAFVMSGLGVGVGAFLTLVYTPSVTTTTASSIGMNIFIAIVFGGMPISGGARSKIYAALIGGFSFMLLNDILELVIDGSAAYGMTQLVSAVCFLLVVYMTSLNYKTDLLPR